VVGRKGIALDPEILNPENDAMTRRGRVIILTTARDFPGRPDAPDDGSDGKGLERPGSALVPPWPESSGRHGAAKSASNYPAQVRRLFFA
jgi:hypothetical protein